jgi:hypothetical protein
MAYQEPGLYIIPEVSLTCSTQSREKVEGIIAGELINHVTDAADTSQFLVITWWQQIEKEIYQYNLTATATITELKPIGRHVYSFTLNVNDDNRLNTVSAGNVLGIRINTRLFNLYYDASRIGIINHRVLAARFELSDSNPISIPTIANVSTDMNTAIRGAPLLSFGDRGIATMYNSIKLVL